MKNNLQSLTELIDFLKLHKVESCRNRKLSLETLRELTNELRIKRRNFLRENIQELKLKIKENYGKLKISALRLMEYDWNENSHSNILAYLVDYNSFGEGHKVLSKIVQGASVQNHTDLCKKVAKRTYTVEREYRIPSGRIDLFILDESQKFVIIIENKILSGIGEIIGKDENLGTSNQLKKYEDWCKKNYVNYSYLFILLNYSNNEENIYSFEKISYKQLYSFLQEFKSNDNVFEEYLRLLNSILNTKAYDLFEIKKLANKIITEENTEISLTDYYTLKNIFYAK
jgi:hypothetical protein